MKTTIAGATPYPTRDGSEIRELMHPALEGASHRAMRQSLAEATILPGQKTLMHRHWVSHERYHVSSGGGRMVLGEEVFEVGIGDTVCIAPATEHWIENTGTAPLRVLEHVCTPADAHEDTLWSAA